MKKTMMVIVAGLAFSALAQGPVRNVPGAAMMPVDPLVRAALNPKAAEKLGVTPEQTAQLKALAEDKSAMRDLQEKARKSMSRQTELLAAEKVDEAAVMAAFDEFWAARKEMAKLQMKRLIAVRSILSAEQMSKAREVMREMRRGNAPRPKAKGPKSEPKAEPKAAKPTAEG